jgi:arylsulfatase A-like enzyme
MSARAAVEGSGLSRPFVVSELSEYGKKDRQGRMLRTRRYKYVVFNGGARPEQLFDLELDPGETQNIASNTAVLSEHRQLLDQWIAETKDDFVRPS